MTRASTPFSSSYHCRLGKSFGTPERCCLSGTPEVATTSMKLEVDVRRGTDRDATALASVASKGRQPNRWAVLALASVAQLMVVLAATIVTIALRSAQKALGFSKESRRWSSLRTAGVRGSGDELVQLHEPRPLGGLPPKRCHRWHID